jgi:hypothetical protein
MSEFNTSELNQSRFNTQTLKEEDKEKETKYHNDNFRTRRREVAARLDISLDIVNKVGWIEKSAFLTKQDLDDFHHTRVSINYLYQKHKILEERFVVDQILRKNRTEEELFEEAKRLFEENHK